MGYVECDDFDLTFYGATSFTGDGLSNWDTSSVTTLYGTFDGATSFTGDGVSNWDTSRVTTLSSTFEGATSFTGDGVSNWDTSSVTRFVLHILRCDLVHGRRIVKLGYVECDDVRKNILRCDLVHGRWSIKLGYVEGDDFEGTFTLANFVQWNIFIVGIQLSHEFVGAFAEHEFIYGRQYRKLGHVKRVTDLRYMLYCQSSSSFDPENIHGWNIQRSIEI